MGEAETKPADLSVTVNQPDKSMNRWQWISVVGVGTFLIVPIVFWMMNMISKVIPANTQAITSMTDQSKDVEGVLRTTNRRLKTLSERLGPEDEEVVEPSE